MDALPDVGDEHPLDLRPHPGVDQVHQLGQQQRDAPRRKEHRERHRTGHPAEHTVLTGDQWTAQIPYPAQVSTRARVGDHLHHGSECRSRDIGQRRRDHADDEQSHDRPTNRAEHAEAASDQTIGAGPTFRHHFDQLGPPLPGARCCGAYPSIYPIAARSARLLIMNSAAWWIAGRPVRRRRPRPAPEARTNLCATTRPGCIAPHTESASGAMAVPHGICLPHGS